MGTFAFLDTVSVSAWVSGSPTTGSWETTSPVVPAHSVSTTVTPEGSSDMSASACLASDSVSPRRSGTLASASASMAGTSTTSGAAPERIA